MLAKRRWTAQELRDILGEPYTIGPEGHSYHEPGRTIGVSRAVTVGNKVLEPGEQLGWMSWNCAGGDALEHHRQEFFNSIAAHGAAITKGELAGPISPIDGYLSCVATDTHESAPRSWAMTRICRRHYPLIGDDGD